MGWLIDFQTLSSAFKDFNQKLYTTNRVKFRRYMVAIDKLGEVLARRFAVYQKEESDAMQDAGDMSMTSLLHG